MLVAEIVQLLATVTEATKLAEFGAAWVDGDGFYRLETSGDPWQWNLMRYDLP